MNSISEKRDFRPWHNWSSRKQLNESTRTETHLHELDHSHLDLVLFRFHCVFTFEVWCFLVLCTMGACPQRKSKKSHELKNSKQNSVIYVIFHVFMFQENKDKIKLELNPINFTSGARTTSVSCFCLFVVVACVHVCVYACICQLFRDFHVSKWEWVEQHQTILFYVL